MKIIRKKDVTKLEAWLRIRSVEYAYIKLENPEVIQEYIKMVREEAGVILTMDDFPDSLEDV